MTDEEVKEPVVDSRQPGFNPEVEASHAEAAAAAAAAQPAPEPAPAPPPPTKRSLLVELLEELVRAHGNHPRMTALLEEFKQL